MHFPGSTACWSSFSWRIATLGRVQAYGSHHPVLSSVAPQLPKKKTYLQMGVVNRDIKLENTLLNGDRRPLLKICDFGYSKNEKDSLPKSKVGTPGYTGGSFWASYGSPASLWQ